MQPFRVPTYVIRHHHPPPDEVHADSYVEVDGFLVFLEDGKEILRIPLTNVVTVGLKGET